MTVSDHPREPLPLTPTGLHWATCVDPHCSGCVTDEQLAALRQRAIERARPPEPADTEPAPPPARCEWCGEPLRSEDLLNPGDGLLLTHGTRRADFRCPGPDRWPGWHEPDALGPDMQNRRTRFVLVMLPLTDSL